MAEVAHAVAYDAGDVAAVQVAAVEELVAFGAGGKAAQGVHQEDGVVLREVDVQRSQSHASACQGAVAVDHTVD